MSKSKKTREQKLAYIFAQYPKDKEFHVTSDDQAFRNPSDAANHAKSLKDKEVKVEKRSDYVKSSDSDAKAEKEVKVDEKKVERDALFAKHEELFKQKPASNASTEKLKAKIEAEEARLAEVAAKEAESQEDQTGEEE